MPLIRVDLDRALYEEKHEALSREIHQAQIDALDIPADDKFQTFHTHDAGEIKFDATYGGVDRQSLVIIQILMVRRYKVEEKRALYRAIITRLEAIGVRREDVQIGVVENYYEDWFAGTLAD
jgi:hypothetical protein